MPAAVIIATEDEPIELLSIAATRNGNKSPNPLRICALSVMKPTSGEPATILPSTEPAAVIKSIGPDLFNEFSTISSKPLPLFKRNVAKRSPIANAIVGLLRKSTTSFNCCCISAPCSMEASDISIIGTIIGANDRAAEGSLPLFSIIVLYSAAIRSASVLLAEGVPVLAFVLQAEVVLLLEAMLVLASVLQEMRLPM